MPQFITWFSPPTTPFCFKVAVGFLWRLCGLNVTRNSCVWLHMHKKCVFMTVLLHPRAVGGAKEHRTDQPNYFKTYPKSQLTGEIMSGCHQVVRESGRNRSMKKGQKPHRESYPAGSVQDSSCYRFLFIHLTFCESCLISHSQRFQEICDVILLK